MIVAMMKPIPRPRYASPAILGLNPYVFPNRSDDYEMRVDQIDIEGIG